MQKIIAISRVCLTVAFVFAQTIVPLSMIQSTVLAEEGSVPDTTASTQVSETAPSETDKTTATTEQGTAQQEPEAVKDPYVYNDSTGTWENSKYSWNPDTFQSEPKEEKSYSYNPETQRWDTNTWVYDPTSQAYDINKKLSVSDPSTETPNTVHQQLPAGSSQDFFSEHKSDLAQPLSVTHQNTGDKEKSLAVDKSSGYGIFDLFFDAKISNTLTSLARSGDAAVTHNTYGGSALTGDAIAIATILNMLQSTWGLNTQDIATFISNIEGDVFGDIYIDPSSIPGTQSVKTETAGSQNDLTVRSTTNNSIENDIYLEAISGDATVSKNTVGGDAITGDTLTMANVINFINASISSGNSFIGTININGNLEGDILLPQWLQNHLIASGVTNAAMDFANGNHYLDASVTNNTTIANNIVATAQSGDAIIASNTSAGNASSGNASTNITLLNLTGHHIVGSNSLLVFVNVLGEWVGLIVNAPQGATSAMLASGVTNHSVMPLSGDVEVTNNQYISNNIYAHAQSGDATVAYNSEAGDAVTGNASSAVNVLNVANSSFSFSDWFGILFINVFGTWHGSFGIDTPMGNLPLPGLDTQPLKPNSNQRSSSPRQQPQEAFTFAPRDQNTALQANSTRSTFSATTSTSQEEEGQQVLGATSSGGGSTPLASQIASAPVSNVSAGIFEALFFLVLSGGTLSLLVWWRRAQEDALIGAVN